MSRTIGTLIQRFGFLTHFRKSDDIGSAWNPTAIEGQSRCEHLCIYKVWKMLERSHFMAANYSTNQAMQLSKAPQIRGLNLERYEQTLCTFNLISPVLFNQNTS